MDTEDWGDLKRSRSGGEQPLATAEPGWAQEPSLWPGRAVPAVHRQRL